MPPEWWKGLKRFQLGGSVFYSVVRPPGPGEPDNRSPFAAVRNFAEGLEGGDEVIVLRPGREPSDLVSYAVAHDVRALLDACAALQTSTCFDCGVMIGATDRISRKAARGCEKCAKAREAAAKAWSPSFPKRPPSSSPASGS